MGKRGLWSPLEASSTYTELLVLAACWEPQWRCSGIWKVE